MSPHTLFAAPCLVEMRGSSLCMQCKYAVTHEIVQLFGASAVEGAAAAPRIMWEYLHLSADWAATSFGQQAHALL